MASFYPVRKERAAPVSGQAVAASLRAGHARQERAERQGPATAPTPSQKLHKELVSKQNTVEDLLRMVSEAPELDSNNVATAIHKVAQCGRREPRGIATARADPRFKVLLSKVEVSSSGWTSRQLCHLAWSFAVLTSGPSPLLYHVGKEFASRPDDDHVPQDISTFAWALATVALHDKELMESISKQTMLKLSEFGPQDLSITAWAFAKLLTEDRQPLITAIGKQSLMNLDTFSGRNLANLSWAFATSQQRDLDLSEALVKHCSARIHEFGPQELPIALWSFAASGYPCQPIFDVAAEQAIKSLHGMDVSHICNVLWSFARAGARNEELFEVFGEEALRRVSEMQPLHLANLAWSFAKVQTADEFDTRRVGCRNEPLFAAIAQATAKSTAYMSPQNLSSLLGAFASCSVDKGGDLLADAAYRNLKLTEGRIETRHAAGMLWSLAALSVKHQPLAEHLVLTVSDRGIDGLASDGPAHLASLAWAASRLSLSSLPLFRTALRSNVDGLLAALAGSLAELSDGRRQNFAAAIRSLYSSGLADTAKALFIRTQDAEVEAGAEAWSAWLAGAQSSGDLALELQVWGALADSTNERLPYSAQREAVLMNASAIRAMKLGSQELAVQQLESLGGENADSLTADLLEALGKPRSRASIDVDCDLASPRGDSRQELKVAQRLLRASACGGRPQYEEPCELLLSAAESLSLEEAGGVGADLVKFAIGVRGALLDRVAEALLVKGKTLVLDFTGSCGMAAIRLMRQLRASGRSHLVEALSLEADGVRAGIATNLVFKAAATMPPSNLMDVDVRVGKYEQILPWVREHRGAASVGAVLLGNQGIEYWEILKCALDLGLMAAGAVVVADHVLQPLSAELLWRACRPGQFLAVAVELPHDWLLLARYVGNGAFNDTPAIVRQLQHRSDEARQRSAQFRSSDRLARGFRQPSEEGYRSSLEACAKMEVRLPSVEGTCDVHGRWLLNLPDGILNRSNETL